MDKSSGRLSIGKYVGDELHENAVYSGGSSEILSKLVGAKGKDVLYVGDHIYGDVVKSKKIRGWRTFLIVPELNDELSVWTSKQEMWTDVQRFDQELSQLYRNLDQSDKTKPDVEAIKRESSTPPSTTWIWPTGQRCLSSGPNRGRPSSPLRS